MNRFILQLMLSFIVAITSGESFAQPPVYEQRSYVQNGESEDFFTKKYGRPAYEFVKPRYAFVGEYSVGIENTYRSINPEFRNIPIKEAFRKLKDDLNLPCFFQYQDGQWRVISYFFWPPHAKF